MDEIVNVLRLADGKLNARKLHKQIAEILRGNGYNVRCEFPAPYSKVIGRIDILAEKNGETYGIEIDRNSPRRKSIEKLAGKDWHSIIVLRKGDEKLVPGVDAIVSLL